MQPWRKSSLPHSKSPKLYLLLWGKAHQTHSPGRGLQQLSTVTKPLDGELSTPAAEQCWIRNSMPKMWVESTRLPCGAWWVCNIPSRAQGDEQKGMQPQMPVIISAAGRGNSCLNAQLGEPGCEGSVCAAQDTWSKLDLGTLWHKARTRVLFCHLSRSGIVMWDYLTQLQVSCAEESWLWITRSISNASLSRRKKDWSPITYGFWSRWRNFSWDPLQLVINCTVFLQTSTAWSFLSNLQVGNS